MRKLFDKFEQIVESDRFTLKQRLGAAALGFTILYGGAEAAIHFEVDEHVTDGVASIIGYDEPIRYHD